MKLKTKHILLALFSIGLFLRLYNLTNNVPELYADETGHYFYWSWLQGQHLNSTIDIIYSITFRFFSLTWLLGLNPLGVRLSAALFGSLIPIFVYLCFSQINKDRTTPILTTLIVAFAPWGFMISRIGHTHIPILVILTLAASYFFLKGRRTSDYISAIALLVVALYYYPSIIFITPILIILIMRELFPKLSPQQAKLSYAFIGILVSTSLYIFLVLHGGLSKNSRGLDLAIWRDPNTTYHTDKSRAISWLSQPDIFSFYQPVQKISDPLLYNRLTANLGIFTNNYLSFFSPDFLFLKGDPIMRHSTGSVGAFYSFLLPFMIYGAYSFFRTAKSRNRNLFLVWILASPIPAAITKDGAQYLLRAITMMPFLTYFAALGITTSFSIFKKHSYRVLYGLIIFTIGVYSVYGFFFDYFHVYPYRLETARSYEYGFKDLADFQIQHNNEPMLIIWSGYYPQNHFVFWQKTSAKDHLEYTFEDVVVGQSHFYRSTPTLYFSKPYSATDLQDFIVTYRPAYLVTPDPYFVSTADLVDDTSVPEKIIFYPTGKEAFKIYKVNDI